MIQFVSSVGFLYHELCGRLFCESFIQNVAASVGLWLYCDATLEQRNLNSYSIPPDSNGRIEAIDLGIRPEVVSYLSILSSTAPIYNSDPKKRLNDPQYDWLRDGRTFGLKGLSLSAALERDKEKYRYVFWCDADVVIRRKVSVEMLLGLFKDEAGVVYFGRENPFTETGFIGFDRESQGFEKFVKEYAAEWREGRILSFPDLTDCSAFDRALAKAKCQGLKAYSLSTQPTGHVMAASPLGMYFDHQKGKRKLKI